MDKLPELLDTICANIFGYKNPFTPQEFMQKFGFDIRLPQQVNDSTDGTPTWAQSTNPTKYITVENARTRNDIDDWVLPKRPLNSMEEVLAAWAETNYMTTERQVESLDIFESDNVYNSQSVYRSTDIHHCKNIFACNAVSKLEYAACSQRSNTCTYSIRVEDSIECSNSFNVIWSGKISNSLFMNDCFNMSDSMFCSHMAGKRFCIANMQFEEEEYREIRKMVVEWILTS